MHLNPVAAERVARCRVLVVGDAMLDRYWFGSVDRISPEAPVPVLRVTREEDRLGGAANVALSIQRLGAQCSLMTVVGDDSAAGQLERLLGDAGIQAHLERDAQAPTTVKLRLIGHAQQLLRADFEQRPGDKVLSSMLARFEESPPAFDAIVFSDYGKGGLAQIARMLPLAARHGRPVLVDPKGSDYSRYAGATVITPNRSELALAVGAWSSEAELEDKAQQLRTALGIASLVLTRSEEGISVFDDQGHLQVPAQAKEVFDVTGAGDTVIATLATMVGCGLPVRQAVQIANRAGGIVVGKFGTATVSWAELFA